MKERVEAEEGWKQRIYYVLKFIYLIGLKSEVEPDQSGPLGWVEGKFFWNFCHKLKLKLCST